MLSTNGEAIKKMGIVWAFVAITPILFMVRETDVHTFQYPLSILIANKIRHQCIVAALALGNVNITKDDIHSGDDSYKANLTEESYLYTIIGRRRKKSSE